jgi:hypothetical protein
MSLCQSFYGLRHGLEYYGGEAVPPPNWELQIHTLTRRLYVQTKTNDALEEDIEDANQLLDTLKRKNKILRTRNVSLAKRNRELTSRNAELKKAVLVVHGEEGAKRVELKRKLALEEKSNDEAVYTLESRIEMLEKELKELKDKVCLCGEGGEGEGWEGDDEVRFFLNSLPVLRYAANFFPSRLSQRRS